MNRNIYQVEEELGIAIKQLERLRGAILNVCSLYHFTPDLWEPEQSLKRLLEVNSRWTLDPQISSDASKLMKDSMCEGAFLFADYLNACDFSSAVAAKESGFVRLAEIFSNALRKEELNEI